MIGLKGYSYLWILIIIIIGSFFLAGGQFMFEDLNELGIKPTPTLAPGLSGGNPAPPSEWSLDVKITCLPNNQTSAAFTVTAPTYHAFLIIQIKNDLGQYATNPVFSTVINSASENAPVKTLESGYSTREWQAILYEGNAVDPSKQKAQLLNQQPTGC